MITTRAEMVFRQQSSVIASVLLTSTMLTVVTKFILIALFFYRCSADDVKERYYPRYHLAPPYGWMNDPNGFSKYRNEYHLFYQYNPETSQEPGIAHWGHATSYDLFNWVHQRIAMSPDKSYDKNGVFSGSAIVVNDTMYFFYTGNVNHPGENPDNEQRQALASSTDGIHVTKYAGNPVIRAEEHQPNIRDPKVWEHCGTYYMVLGNSFKNNTLGQVLLYSSLDLVNWKQVSVIDQSDGSLGYMWECPDFFELDGHHVLLFSPQGIKPQNDKYNNLFQNGYIVGHFDYTTLKFTPKTKFRELDHGHDRYASQTMLDKGKRRLEISWFSMWEKYYKERNDGFAGLMTVPRVLSLSKHLRIIQKPAQEIRAARGATLFSGKPQGGHTVQLDDKAGEIKITASMCHDFNLFIESTNASVSISYDYLKGTVTLDRGGEDGIRRTEWRPVEKLEWYILVDASSIELFCGEGEVTFSSRFFPDGDTVCRLGKNVQVEHMSVSAMKRTMPKPGKTSAVQ